MEGQVFIESTPPPLPDPGGPGGPGGPGATGPAAGPSPARENALRKVRAPAIALIAMGVLVLATAFVNAVISLGVPDDPSQMTQAREQIERLLRKLELDPAVRELVWKLVDQSSGGNRLVSLAIDVLHAVLGAFIALSGVRLLSLRGRTMALFASVVSMIPCVTPCATCCCCPSCIIGIPVGVWVIATLQRADVFDQFR